MKILITIDDYSVTATLEDNTTSRDFLAMLPLQLELRDFASSEKIADLPQRLSTQDAPAGYKPKAGDITLYAPWGNLAIFYRSAPYASGLVRLGKIDDDDSIDRLARLTDTSSVRIELRQ